MKKSPYILKRPFDIVFSLMVLIVSSPILLTAIIAVWLQDFKTPFYLATRVARHNRNFTMIKVRSMRINADTTGVNSTSKGDARVTKVGSFIRRYKIDELSQFINVLLGSMSVVGPRPNTRAWGVDLYNDVELKLLTVRPGITDLSSIVFSDEGEILMNHEHADKAYNALIRPWKSRLGLLYIKNKNLALDIRIIFSTLVTIYSRDLALKMVENILLDLNADETLIEVCRRNKNLTPATPPGEHGLVRPSPDTFSIMLLSS